MVKDSRPERILNSILGGKMPFEAKCPHCKAEFQAEADWEGLLAECPSCNQEITITKPEPEGVESVTIALADQSPKATAPPPLPKKDLVENNHNASPRDETFPQKCPVSVLIISILLFVFNGIGIFSTAVLLLIPVARKMIEKSSTLSLAIIIAMCFMSCLFGIISGVGMIRRKNWARILYLLSSILIFGIQFITSKSPLGLIYAFSVFMIMAFFLCRPKPNAFFKANIKISPVTWSLVWLGSIGFLVYAAIWGPKTVSVDEIHNTSNGYCIRNSSRPFSGTAEKMNSKGVLLKSCGYKNGKKHGLEQEWNDKGQLIVTRSYHEGSRQGPTSYFYADGKPKYEYQFENNYLEGPAKFYLPNGDIKQGTFSKNAPTDGDFVLEKEAIRSLGNIKNIPHGQIDRNYGKVVCSFSNSKPNGKFTVYRDLSETQIAVEGHYKNGIKDGGFKYGSGKRVVREEEFENNILTQSKSYNRYEKPVEFKRYANKKVIEHFIYNTDTGKKKYEWKMSTEGNGTEKRWDNSWKLIFEGSYKNGKKYNGIFSDRLGYTITAYKDGKKLRITSYESNKTTLRAETIYRDGNTVEKKNYTKGVLSKSQVTKYNRLIGEYFFTCHNNGQKKHEKDLKTDGSGYERMWDQNGNLVGEVFYKNHKRDHGIARDNYTITVYKNGHPTIKTKYSYVFREIEKVELFDKAGECHTIIKFNGGMPYQKTLIENGKKKTVKLKSIKQEELRQWDLLKRQVGKPSALKSITPENQLLKKVDQHAEVKNLEQYTTIKKDTKRRISIKKIKVPGKAEEFYMYHYAKDGKKIYEKYLKFDAGYERWWGNDGTLTTEGFIVKNKRFKGDFKSLRSIKDKSAVKTESYKDGLFIGSVTKNDKGEKIAEEIVKDKALSIEIQYKDGKMVSKSSGKGKFLKNNVFLYTWYKNGIKRSEEFSDRNKKSGFILGWDNKGELITGGIQKKYKKWSGTFPAWTLTTTGGTRLSTIEEFEKGHMTKKIFLKNDPKNLIVLKVELFSLGTNVPRKTEYFKKGKPYIKDESKIVIKEFHPPSDKLIPSDLLVSRRRVQSPQRVQHESVKATWPNGKTKYEKKFDNKTGDGYETWFDVNGKQQIKGIWKNFKKFNGIFANPKYRTKELYKDGILNHAQIFSPNKKDIEIAIKLYDKDEYTKSKFINKKLVAKTIHKVKDNRMASESAGKVIFELHPNGKLKFESHNNPYKKTSEKRHWDETGQLIAEGQYKGPKLWNGTFLMERYENGKKKDVRYIYEKKEGKTVRIILYDKMGHGAQKVKEQIFDKNIEIVEVIKYKNGQPHVKEEYKNKKLVKTTNL
jgi:antitoxin component YwqK of YwqJK toxin-antitoxin module